MKKRILSVLLSFMVCFQLFPFGNNIISAHAAHSHIDSCYIEEAHKEHDHCGETQSTCTMCEGTGEIKDHVANWVYPDYDVITGYIYTCSYCGFSDADGIPFFKMICRTCNRSISVRGCCDYEKRLYDYCYVDCEWCSGGTVNGYFDVCDAGCKQHNGHTEECLTYRTFDANGNLTGSWQQELHYFTKIHEWDSDNDLYLTGIDVNTWTIYGHGQWSNNTPAREEHIWPSGYACGGSWKLRYTRANLYVYCSDAQYDYSTDEWSSFYCTDYITVSAPLYMCDKCGNYKYYPDEVENKMVLKESVWNDSSASYTYYYTVLPTIHGYYQRTTDEPILYSNGSRGFEYVVRTGSFECNYGDPNWSCDNLNCHRTNGVYYDMSGGESIIPAEGGGFSLKWLPCSKCKGTGQALYPPCPYTVGKHYKADGTAASPVCSHTIINIVFSQ